jgi:RNA polymerase III subunit RPC82 helix-turn-helix domain
VLLTRGRLPLPQLVRVTGLKSRLVRASILVLVQHNLLWHAQTEDDGEIFEINVEECLMRTRLGRFVSKVEELFGPIVNAHHIFRAIRLIIRFSIGYRDSKSSLRSREASSSRHPFPA